MEDFLSMILTGTNLAILGAFLAAALSGMGSAKGVGLVGEAAAGLLSENPGLSGKVLLLEALPGTQGIYGLVTALLVFGKIGLFGGFAELSIGQGAYYLIACLPIALVGLYSGSRQGRVAAAGIGLIAKKPDEVMKAVLSAALVETYALLAALVSLLLVLFA